MSSYFNREHEPGKTRVLVSKIADIRYIVVNTEEDALLLENNLIKKYKPRYNVLLKDDKTYPSICVQNEYFHAYSRHEESYATALRTMVRTATYRPCMRCSTLSSIYIATHLQPEPLSGKHPGREIQRMPGISHQELCRSLRRQTKSGRISEQHRRDKRDTQRQHPRGRADAVSANAGSCRRNEV